MLFLFIGDCGTIRKVYIVLSSWFFSEKMSEKDVSYKEFKARNPFLGRESYHRCEEIRSDVEKEIEEYENEVDVIVGNVLPDKESGEDE